MLQLLIERRTCALRVASLKVFEASGYAWPTLASYRMPTAAERIGPGWSSWSTACRRHASGSANSSRLRKWYEPQLERIYDTARVRIGDIEQLERLSGLYASREQFITELTLDPPQVTSDLAGDPARDEDYLISVDHSFGEKVKEWGSVYVLNCRRRQLPQRARARGQARPDRGRAPPLICRDDARQARSAFGGAA